MAAGALVLVAVGACGMPVESGPPADENTAAEPVRQRLDGPAAGGCGVPGPQRRPTGHDHRRRRRRAGVRCPRLRVGRRVRLAQGLPALRPLTARPSEAQLAACAADLDRARRAHVLDAALRPDSAAAADRRATGDRGGNDARHDRGLHRLDRLAHRVGSLGTLADLLGPPPYGLLVDLLARAAEHLVRRIDGREQPGQCGGAQVRRGADDQSAT